MSSFASWGHRGVGENGNGEAGGKAQPRGLNAITLVSRTSAERGLRSALRADSVAELRAPLRRALKHRLDEAVRARMGEDARLFVLRDLGH